MDILGHPDGAVVHGREIMGQHAVDSRRHHRGGADDFQAGPGAGDFLGLPLTAPCLAGLLYLVGHRP